MGVSQGGRCGKDLWPMQHGTGDTGPQGRAQGMPIASSVGPQTRPSQSEIVIVKSQTMAAETFACNEMCLLDRKCLSTTPEVHIAMRASLRMFQVCVADPAVGS